MSARQLLLVVISRQPTDHIILHIVDECTRWSVAVAILDKTPESIIDAVTTHWLQLHGTPSMMIWDGARAMVSSEALQWASRWKFQLISRAKHSKAWVVEKA